MTTELVPIQLNLVVPIGTGVAEELIPTFLDGKNTRTVEAYRQDFEDFRVFLGVETVSAAAQCLVAGGHGAANILAHRYKADLTNRGLQPTTINRRLASLRSLVKFMRTIGMVSWALEVTNATVRPYRDTRGPGRSGYRSLLQAAEAHRDPRIRLRNVAILHLLHDLALRRGEVAALDLADLDLQTGVVAVMGKGRTQKELLTLPEPTCAALQAWVEVRGTDDSPLFTNFDRAGKGKRLTGSGLYYMIRDLGQRVGVKTRPHGLRHTAITTAVMAAQANGFGLEEVLDFSRHADVKTLLIYRDRERDMQGHLAALVAGSV